MPGADGATEYGDQFDRWHPCVGSKGNVTGGAWDRCITATYELVPGTYTPGPPPIFVASMVPSITLPPGKTTVIPHDKTVTISFQDDTVYQEIEKHFKAKTHLQLKVTEKTYFTPKASPSHWALVPGAQHKRVDVDDLHKGLAHGSPPRYVPARSCALAACLARGLRNLGPLNPANPTRGERYRLTVADALCWLCWLSRGPALSQR